jgi:hypothetical protein
MGYNNTAIPINQPIGTFYFFNLNEMITQTNTAASFLSTTVLLYTGENVYWQ